MNPLLYAKVGAVLLTVAVLFGAGFHFGGLRAEATLDDYKASAATALADALLAQRSAQEAESARINKAVSDYENTPLDPITVGIGHRVFKYATRADCPVSRPATVAGGTEAPAAVPISPAGVERSLGEYIAACAQDAAQLRAVIQLAP